MPENQQVGSGASSDPQTPPGASAATIPPANGTASPAPGAPPETVANPEAKRYADEAAAERTARKSLEAELKKLQDAQLTAEQKRERDFTEMQTRTLEQELKLQRLALENAGLRLAPTLGIADSAAALALVQSEHASEIKYGADGSPENLPELLKAVLKDHPVLAGGAGQSAQSGQQPPASRAQQQPPPSNSGGATNPGRQAGNGGLTPEIISAMPIRERMARMAEIDAWTKANPDIVRDWAARQYTDYKR